MARARRYTPVNYSSAAGRYDIPYRVQSDEDLYNLYRTGNFDHVYGTGGEGGSSFIPSGAMVPYGNLGNAASGASEAASAGTNLAPVENPITGAGSATGAAGAAGGGIKGLFGNLKGKGLDAIANVKGGRGLFPKYANLARFGMGAQAALTAARGISDYENNKNDTSALINQILNSASGNPNYRYDLSQEQLNTLRQLQNGTFDKTADFELGDLFGNAGEALTGAGLGFVLGGGPVGAALGAANGLVKGVSNGMNTRQQDLTNSLQSLYDALYESEMNTKAMRRNAAMSRFQNSLAY